MTPESLLCALTLLLISQVSITLSRCNRRPEGVAFGKSPGDNGYSIKISGNPDKYIPGEIYTVILQGAKLENNVQQKFTSFSLVAESSNPNKVLSKPTDVGTFQLFVGDALTKFSDNCPNMVTHTSSFSKPEIQVMWTAPPSGFGCVDFRGMVVEPGRGTWYMDNGELTKQLCEEKLEDENTQPEIIEECCVCDEAKYEVTFEGLWTRHTHPKDFPTNEWLTHFSDIIGSSHSANYRVWEYGGVASDGLRNLAEYGATSKLERELKNESKHLRTIIKARGLWHPNVNGKTFAVFRVDKKHHLMSLVSMLGPSPDWIVGVSALELCHRNCSWIESKVLNLYPWDAGTDNGISYMSPNSPATPREKIRRITTSWPSDPRAPFYDPEGGEMKPVAKLTIKRQRIYEKSCSDQSVFEVQGEVEHPDNTEDALRPECEVTAWSDFSPCSVTCGKGLRMRQRSFKMAQKAKIMECNRQLVEKEMCIEPECSQQNGDESNSICAVTEWSQWSECSATCGQGYRSKTRRYYNRMGYKHCDQSLKEKEFCMATLETCPFEEAEEIPESCAMTSWSDWSPCTVTCGEGVKIRQRMMLYTDAQSDPTCSQFENMQKIPCFGDRHSCELSLEDAQEVCMDKKEVGPCRGSYLRWYYDHYKGMCVQFIYGGCRGNKNNFETHGDCNRMCETNKGNGGSRYDQHQDSPFDRQSHNQAQYSALVDRRPGYPEAVDCVVSEWTDWSACKPSCGKGTKEKRRIIKVHPSNGGKPCPKKILKRKKCRNPKCERESHLQAYNLIYKGSASIVDCVLGEWDPWSPCSKTCGPDGVQERVRRRLVKSYNGGTQCGPTLERRYCSLPRCPPY